MKKKTVVSFLLLLCMLVAVLPTPAYAATATAASNSLIEYIKSCEGFRKYAYWDYQHYSIGYGTTCSPDQFPNGITEAQAEQELRKVVASAESSVNSFVQKNHLTPSQNQFDCMVSLTYALGAVWMSSSYNLPKLFVKEGLGELELLNCMGDWVNAGGQTLNGLIYRRMSETYMYFHGVYQHFTGGMDCPYACLKLDANGGSVSPSRIYTFMGSAYGLQEPLPVPVKSGYQFIGWFDDAGNQLTDASPASAMLRTVHAGWAPVSTCFSDVYETDWFCNAVLKTAEENLFAGYPDGTFRPNTSMTRAMFVQVLYRMQAEPACDAALPFTDVDEGRWYYDAVRWAYSTGIVNGISAETFAPDQWITREQMATMLYKFAEKHGATDASTHETLDAFRDAGSVSAYARTALQWAVGAGLMNGTGDSMLSPKNDATRAQAATILVRLSDVLKQGIA